ncbi:hypothetical protein WKM37_000078 [Listeria monocytogenes]|uniref:Uncharacterized protein n=1 Tax=Listeria monocytogenes TaxID=1639 RepID=A0A823J928_LISMN|nr:hypothetical protein [Listeria monocytogenes]EAC5129640.1 hypothetical protein [Listeria monocytogenes]EAE2932136.1 hypothetical protein [Listeria monocytogenes]EAG8119948.1 hypothetical protein [Listeria monocytogenes]EAG8216182.1 hypothetical protein [Listeria monocytogenes]EAG9676227.1 hypothetical protein [Listeria monocytogenes]
MNEKHETKQSEAQKVIFNISGEYLSKSNGYNLYYLSEALSLFNEIVEKTYLLVENRQHMTEKDREKVFVTIHDIREGSFETDLFIHIRDTTFALLPLVSSLDPKTIWKMINEAYKYLKTVLKAKKEGERVYISNTESSEVINIINSSSGKIVLNIHPDSLRLAERIVPQFAKMSNLVTDDEAVTNLSITDTSSEENISFDKSDKSLYERSTTWDQETLSFEGIIVTANGMTVSGKIKVEEGTELLPAGEYPYEFMDKDCIDDIRSSLMIKRKMVALRKVRFDPIGLKEKVEKLKIVRVN